MKQGRAFLQQNEWSIVKTINLEGIASDLKFNALQYSKFCKKITVFSNNSHFGQIKEFKAQVEYIQNEATEKLQQMVPSKRVKRGLVNPLGSLIKVITGNLDNEDAVRFEQLITTLETREQTISNKITLITEMLDHVVNSTKIMNENSKILNDKINKIEKLVKEKSIKSNDDFLSSYIISVLDLFIFNFRTISVKLSDIETSLALSKASVLHKAVLDSMELLTSLKEISVFGKLMYPVNDQNLINLEETFTVKTYLMDSNVRFIINIPLVDNVTYSYYKLYSLPVSHYPSNETFAIIPEFPYLLVEGTRYRPLVQKCKEITAKDYLCSENDLAVYAGETCVEQLMKFQLDLPKCTPQRVEPEDLKTQKISYNTWIIICKSEKMLLQKCGDDVMQEQLRGTYLLTIRKSCDVHIDTLPIHGYHSHLLGSSYKHVPVINLPNLRENVAEEMDPVNLKGINLDDIQHLNYLLKKTAKSDNSVVQVKSYGIATIVLYIIIIAIAVYITWFKFKPCIQGKCNKEEAEDDNELNVVINDRPILLH